MPYEMWDKPPAEVTDLKAKCEHLLEKYESEIEDWYNEGETVPLNDFLCKNLVLKGKDDKCLSEKIGLPPPPAEAPKTKKNQNVKKAEL